MSDVVTALIEELNDLRRKVENLERAEVDKRSATSGTPIYSSLGVNKVVFTGGLGQLASDLNFTFDPTTKLLSTSGNVKAAEARIGRHPTYASNFMAFWKDGADYSVLADGTNTYINAASGSNIFFRNGNVTKAAIDANTNVWQTPTLVNGWTNYGVGFNNVGYFKDSNGIVHLRGLVKNGSFSAGIFTLPAGYRPTGNYIFSTYCSDQVTQCRVYADGTVWAWSGVSNAWYSIDGIRFAAF